MNARESRSTSIWSGYMIHAVLKRMVRDTDDTLMPGSLVAINYNYQTKPFRVPVFYLFEMPDFKTITRSRKNGMNGIDELLKFEGPIVQRWLPEPGYRLFKDSTPSRIIKVDEVDEIVRPLSCGVKVVTGPKAQDYIAEQLMRYYPIPFRK